MGEKEMSIIEKKSKEYAPTTADEPRGDAITMSYIAGANYVINEIQSILNELHIQGTSLFAWGYIQDKLKELKEDGKD